MERLVAGLALLLLAAAAAAPDPEGSTHSRRLIRVSNTSYTSMCGAFEVVPDETITAPLLAPFPADCCTGCHLAVPPPRRWVALISRGNCSFVQKITTAQKLGSAAVIVYNYRDDRIVRMGATT